MGRSVEPAGFGGVGARCAEPPSGWGLRGSTALPAPAVICQHSQLVVHARIEHQQIVAAPGLAGRVAAWQIVTAAQPERLAGGDHAACGVRC